jgi:dTDP-4-dehydrorhamnose 3,5-epimerase
MRRLPTELDGPVLISPEIHGDERGFFVETYRRSELAEFGVDDEFVQDNHSRSRRGIVRGMHYQTGMSKLVRCSQGSIFDVVVDVRTGSPTFGQWEGYELTDVNALQLYCPVGFAHGFCVLSEIADVAYKTSAYYDPSAEGGFVFDDPQVGIEWPRGVEWQVSGRDRAAPRLSEIAATLPFKYAPSPD